MKTSQGKSGKFALSTIKITLLSQVLASANGTHLISDSRMHAYKQGDLILLPLISYHVVLESPGKFMEF